MQIVCPNCSTAYEIPDAVFGGRARKLRCEQCGTQWRAGPPDAEAPQGGGALPPEPEAGRVFGKPVDARAKAEFQQAMAREGHTPEEEQPQPASGGEPEDAFINLVMAARSRAIEFEPEPEPEPRFRPKGPVLIGGLVVAFLVVVAFLLLHLH